MQIEEEFCQVLVKGISFELFFFSISKIKFKIKNLPKTTRYDFIYNSLRDSYVLKKIQYGISFIMQFSFIFLK